MISLSLVILLLLCMAGCSWIPKTGVTSEEVYDVKEGDGMYLSEDKRVIFWGD